MRPVRIEKALRYRRLRSSTESSAAASSTVWPLGKFHSIPPDTQAPRMPMRAHLSTWL